MMVQQNENDVTASGDSDPQMSAAGGQCSPQVSLSNPSTKSVGSPKQGHTANIGVGNVTAVGGAEQALDGGQKATEVTATGFVGNLTDANNEITELCIKFSDLKLKDEVEDKNASDLERYSKKATDLNVGNKKLKRKSRSPEKNNRLKKKIKIKPVENHENIQKFHSIVKVPSDIKCDFHTDLTNSTPAVTSKKKNVSNIRNLDNEVKELCIKFSDLKVKDVVEDKNASDLERYVKKDTDLNVANNKAKRKSRSPEKNDRLKKKIKIKPVENHENIQKFHSIVKVPSDIKCDFHTDLTNSTPAVTSKKKNVSNIRNLDNEVNESCIQFGELKLKNEVQDKNASDLERYSKNATDLNVGNNKLKMNSRLPWKNDRLKKQIKIKPVEHHEQIQKFHSIVKDPPRKIKRNDVIDLTLSDDEEQGSNYIIDLTLSDDEAQGYRTSSKMKRNGIIDLTISDDEEPPKKKR